MRLARWLAVPVIALTLAACGGDQVAYEEVPGDPVDLKVPGTAAALAPATPTPTATPTSEPTVAATPQASTGTTAQPAPQDAQGGDPTAPGTDAGSGGAAVPDSNASESFCAANPGAC